MWTGASCGGGQGRSRPGSWGGEGSLGGGERGGRLRKPVRVGLSAASKRMAFVTDVFFQM